MKGVRKILKHDEKEMVRTNGTKAKCTRCMKRGDTETKKDQNIERTGESRTELESCNLEEENREWEEKREIGEDIGKG